MDIVLKDYKLRLMAKEEIKPVAEMLAETFYENSVYSSMFPDAKMKREGLKWLFERNLRLHYRKKCTRILTAPDIEEVKSANEVIGTLSWVPPLGLGIDFFDYIKNGLLLMPFRFGLDSMKRMLYYMNSNDAEIEAVIGNQPYWYLGMVAVQKPYRGKGIATAMIKAHLENVVDAANKEQNSEHKIPVLLTTQLESNVRLYSSLGFKVMKEEVIGYGHEKFHSWCMIRYPGQ